MWPGFKSFFSLPKAMVLAWALLALPATAQQLVYDLQQDWVYYNEEHQGFLPIEEKNLNLHAISFPLGDPEFKPFYLAIGVGHKSYLFHRSQLIATLPVGVTSFDIDSLQRALNGDNLLLTIYGDNLLPYLATTVRTKPVSRNTVQPFAPVRFANHFSNFFYLAITLIALFFVLLKVFYPDLTHQYLLFQRAMRVKTIDELIYKIPYLGFPNILFLALIALVFSLIVVSLAYLFPGTINSFGINPGAMGFGRLLLAWLMVTAIFLVVLIAKYLLILLVSSAFDLRLGNYHFASFLRLLFILAGIFILLVGGQYIIIGSMPVAIYWLVLLLGIVAIEAILFFKLSLLTSHTLLYIFVYLCATEIIPMALMLKFITG